ncbi:unnamed protein product [Ambrosiozyma monospora]|uniref:Unnamed protein product n=1 Tax=Ambrosiozyma monospora TaxID=43982 RepID=A0A9W7DGR1_AMBMO|nr:unnamed protein product [Ambrosiozyma monospora]
MTESSVSVVTKYLNHSQRQEICLNLVDQIVSKEEQTQDATISAFCDLIDSVPDLKPKIEERITKFCLELLQNEQNPQSETILKLSENFDGIPHALIQFISLKCITFYNINIRSFGSNIKKLVGEKLKQKSIEEDSSITTEEVSKLFQFTEWLFMTREQWASSFENDLIDNVCVLYLASDNKHLCQLALKILRWRMDYFISDPTRVDYLWSVIFNLMESHDDSQRSAGFTLWLRVFNKYGLDKLYNESTFQARLKHESYWYHLRDGLISGSHEHKKFALTLTQMSVRSISIDLDLPIMQWNVKQRDVYLEGWKRFCTLYEILGIDTAMNQAEAASNDMIRVLSPSSNIPVPFALTIPSVGFKASQESVRKFAMNLVFALPKESLGLFRHDFKFLTDVFLPFTLNAFHFNTTKLMDNTYKCEFGIKLSDFVRNCVLGLDDNEDISTFSEMLLQV